MRHSLSVGVDERLIGSGAHPAAGAETTGFGVQGATKQTLFDVICCQQTKAKTKAIEH
jgi:hypothetical protein